MDDSYKKQRYEYYAKGDTFLGKGFKLTDVKRENLIDIIQKPKSRNVHTFILGASGMGKSKLMEGPMEEDIKAGRNIIVIDPKGGGDIYSRMVQAAYSSGRQKDLMYCSAIFPEHSIDINLMSHFYMEDELISHAMAAVSTDNDFFYGSSYECATFVIKGLLAIRRYENNNNPLTLKEVMMSTSYVKIVELRDKLKILASHEHEGAAYLLSLSDSMLESGEEHYNKVTKSLRVALVELTSGSTGQIIGDAKNNEFIDRIETGEGVILYVQTGSMIVKQSSGTIAKVLTSMVQSVVGRFDASGKKMSRPLCYYGDEFSNIAYRGCEDLFNKGRGAGVWATVATQSFADIVAEIGPERASKLMENTTTKMIMRQNDLQSATIISQFGGLKKKYSPMLSLSGGITNREVEDNLIQPTDVMRLKEREFYYFGLEGEFKAKSKPMYEPEIQIEMPSALSRGILT